MSSPSTPTFRLGRRYGSVLFSASFLWTFKDWSREVWTTREMAFIPPFPAFNRAIVDAFRQWRFEPVVVQGERVPLCMTVTHIVDFP